MSKVDTFLSDYEHSVLSYHLGQIDAALLPGDTVRVSAYLAEHDLLDRFYSVPGNRSGLLMESCLSLNIFFGENSRDRRDAYKASVDFALRRVERERVRANDMAEAKRRKAQKLKDFSDLVEGLPSKRSGMKRRKALVVLNSSSLKKLLKTGAITPDEFDLAYQDKHRSLSISAVSDYLGVSSETVDRWDKTGQIAHAFVGRKRMYGKYRELRYWFESDLLKVKINVMLWVLADIMDGRIRPVANNLEWVSLSLLPIRCLHYDSPKLDAWFAKAESAADRFSAKVSFSHAMIDGIGQVAASKFDNTQK